MLVSEIILTFKEREKVTTIGRMVRRLRNERSMKGNELAAAAGVSPSLISQIEHDTTTPSVDVLARIASALGVHVGDFFDRQNDAVSNGTMPSEVARPLVVRANARRKLMLPTSNLVYELLTPDLQGSLELLWIEIGPGLPFPTQASMHQGEEANIVVKGRVHIWVDDEEYVLEEGDSITFESYRPHRTANLDGESAIVICAITPPSF